MTQNALTLAREIARPTRDAMLQRAPSVHHFWNNNTSLFEDAWTEWEDSADLSGSLVGDLRTVASSLNQYPGSVVQVVGHTDNVGDAGYNYDLSERRARSVAGVLISSGVSSSRIQTFGRGEDQPKASNLTPEGRQQNRRVEIVILPTA